MGFLDDRVPLLAGTGDGAWRPTPAIVRAVLACGKACSLFIGRKSAAPVSPCFHWGKPGSHPNRYGIDTEHRQGETWVDVPSLTNGL